MTMAGRPGFRFSLPEFVQTNQRAAVCQMLRNMSRGANSLVLTYDIRKSVEASSKTEDSYYQWKML